MMLTRWGAPETATADRLPKWGGWSEEASSTPLWDAAIGSALAAYDMRSAENLYVETVDSKPFTRPTDGALVGTVSDLSGNNRHLTCATDSERPTWRAPGTATFTNTAIEDYGVGGLEAITDDKLYCANLDIANSGLIVISVHAFVASEFKGNGGAYTYGTLDGYNTKSGSNIYHFGIGGGGAGPGGTANAIAVGVAQYEPAGVSWTRNGQAKNLIPYEIYNNANIKSFQMFCRSTNGTSFNNQCSSGFCTMCAYWDAADLTIAEAHAIAAELKAAFGIP